MYGDPLDRKIAGLAAAANTLRFDASDLMPGAVGSGAEWKGFTDYFSGATDLDTALKQMDAAWPKQ
jgi:alpha-glucoside transport system substrate-binding protein